MKLRGSRIGRVVVGLVFLAGSAWAQTPGVDRAVPGLPLSSEDKALLDDLSHRAFLFFTEQADPGTGLIRDRARTTGVVESEHDRDAASIAATGFGLTALCIGAEHGWIPRNQARQRVLTALHFFAERGPLRARLVLPLHGRRHW